MTKSLVEKLFFGTDLSEFVKIRSLSVMEALMINTNTQSSFFSTHKT
jgi:hypothetical protein